MTIESKVVFHLCSYLVSIKSRSGQFLVALPLYAGLSVSQQLKAFDKADFGHRKCIVSTNIAETSVTIDGIVYVIDSGFVKTRSYNPSSGLESLVVAPISRASADQRAGRAGRNRAGKCFRLYTCEFFEHSMFPHNTPEILRSNLSHVILQLKALGVQDLTRFDFISTPSLSSLAQSIQVLYSLGALDDHGRLTESVGKIMAEFSLPPMLSKMLILSGASEYSCSEEIVSIVAMLSVQSLFYNPSKGFKTAEASRKKFWVKEGDLLTLLNVYNSFVFNRRGSQWCSDHFISFKAISSATNIRAQLVQYLKKFGIPLLSCGSSADSIRKCIVA